MSWSRRPNNPGPANTDKAPPADANPNNDLATQGYTPDQVANSVFPYRGQQTHGVTPNLDPWQRNVDEIVPEVGPALTDFDDDPDPVPVRIVERTSTEIHSWNATQMGVGANPQQIVGRNAARTKVYIKNLHIDTVVYIGRQNGANSLSGFPLDPGVTFTLESTEEVHGVSADPAKSPLIAVLQEFRISAAGDP